MKLLITASSLVLVSILLSGCGGGGGSSTSSTSATTSFPFQAALKTRINSGATDNFTVSGTCTGTATIVTGSASAGTFEGVSGLSAGQTFTTNLNNCTPATSATTATNYYDSTYSPLGSIIPNTEYAKYQALPQPIPTAVRVGDTAVLATLDVFTNSTKTVKTGQRIFSYFVEQDSTTSVFVTGIAKSYNTSNQLLATQQTKYRLSDAGVLTIVSIDVQFSTTSSNRLIYTKN